MPALGQGTGKSAAGEKAAKSHKPKPKKYRLPMPKSGGRGDAPQTRAHDFHVAEAHKRTPSYRRAVRAAYSSRPKPQRMQQLSDIEGKARRGIRLSREDRAIWQAHLSKVSWLMHTRRQPGPVSDRERRAAERFKRGEGYKRLIADLDHSRRKAAEHVDFVHETDRDKLLAAGFHPDGLVENIVSAPKYGLGALGSGLAVGEAAYHDPIGVPLKTAKQAALAVPASIAAVPEFVIHPVKTTEAVAKEFAQRSSQPYSERVKAIRKDGGLSYALDAATVLGAGSGVSKLFTTAAPRAALRLSGGAAKVRRADSGLVGNAVRTRLDVKRAATLEKRLQAAEAGGKPISAIDRQAAIANREAGHVVEVTPRLTYRSSRAQRREGVAKPRGRAVYRLKNDQGRRLKADAKAINRLNKDEKRALYYATQGIRTPEQARALLPGLVSKIKAYRAANGIVVRGRLHKADMLPEIEKILADPEAHFTKKLSDVVDELTPDSLRAGLEDPRFTAETAARRRHAVQAVLLDTERGVADDVHGPTDVPGHRYFDESDMEHVARVAEKADQLGLGTPLYFKSERYPGVRDFAAHAVGIRGMATDPRYKGTNLLSGLQDTSPDAYLRGKARNIKAKHNWNLNKEIIDRNALRDFASPGGDKLSAVVARLAEAGVDPGSVGFVDRNIFDRAMRDHKPDDGHFGEAEDFEQAAIQKALADSIVTSSHLTESNLARSSKWEVVPINVLREMEAQTNPSGFLGRSADIVKGKLSRTILLTGNVPWQVFQLVNDSLAAAVATHGRALNPANWLHSYRWWNHDFTPEQRDRVGGILGLDSTGADSHQVRLGASTNSDLVNTYRAIKAHPFWHTGVAHGHGPSLSQLNPLEIMALVDRKRSNATRILAGFSLAKREAVQRMGENMSRADRAQARITAILTKPPAEQMRALTEDKALLEEHAEAVADWMGDWTTLTAGERKHLNRWVMFYPYMRYSLRLAFYTMPIKHPAMTAIVGELAQLKVEETKKLFGGDQLFWNLGTIRFGKHGDKAIDLKRAHPALNALWDAAGAVSTSDRSLSQLAGILPPWVGMIYDQFAQKSYFTGKDWRVQGKAAPYGGPHLPAFSPTAARVLLDDALSLSFAYRTAEKMTQSGPQGDDSLLWSPRPTHYRGTDTAAKLQRKFGKRNEAFDEDHESLIRELIPLLPQPNRDVERAREDAIVKRAQQPAKKGSRRKKTHYFGARP